jgi:hypothetical protein
MVRAASNENNTEEISNESPILINVASEIH